MRAFYIKRPKVCNYLVLRLLHNFKKKPPDVYNADIKDTRLR